jgi:hypothetical protein
MVDIDILSVSLEEAKKALIKNIEDIRKIDQLKYITTWIKGENSEKLLREITIEIKKNIKKKNEEKSDG